MVDTEIYDFNLHSNIIDIIRLEQCNWWWWDRGIYCDVLKILFVKVVHFQLRVLRGRIAFTQWDLQLSRKLIEYCNFFNIVTIFSNRIYIFTRSNLLLKELYRRVLLSTTLKIFQMRLLSQKNINSQKTHN